MSDNGPEFVHLRLHSAFSLLEGAIPIAKIAELCREDKMPAVAITDNCNLFGSLEFSEKMKSSGIQPIIGCTLPLDFCDNDSNSHNNMHYFPVIALLASTEKGYENLMKLTSKSFLETSENTKPHVQLSDINKLSEGIICLTGGDGGVINTIINENNLEKAWSRVKSLKEIFTDHLYIELQRHGLSSENNAETHLLNIAYDLKLPLIATNEPYFPTAAEYEAHDALICISEGSFVNIEERRKLTPEHYFKSRKEMATLFADIPEAITNSFIIAKRCSYCPSSRAPILPNFTVENSEVKIDEAEELRKQAREGLKERIEKQGIAPDKNKDEYWQRLEFELDVIINMKFPGYFLIVADFIKWAKSQNIPVGPGRGSGAGSIVAWALTITDLDPLRFALLFERFLNPERVSMPDFDIDFCQERRDEVISYVQNKYGKDRVAQIITFGKLQARAVLRDVGRVLQLPYGQVDKLCKLIPNNPANPTTLAEAIEGEPRLREESNRDETVANMLSTGLKLEGLYRHASTHAAGVVISDRPLEQLVPLYRDPRSDMPVTQFNMKWVEQAGLVKFDFLGLKTLTIISDCCKLLKKRNIEIEPNLIPLDDSKTFEMLRKGETIAVFQYESAGMKDLMRKAIPNNIEDLIAIVALFRPGPMENIPKYLAAKHGKEKPEFLHEDLVPVLADTYGVIIYQEQVMEIARVLSGYSLGEADLLRRAMGKKIQAEMDKQKNRFVDGAVRRNVDKSQAEFIFELVNKFAGYGFNKSHSACYAVVAYYTAYLKANHPVEYLAASMTHDSGNTDKLYIFKREANRLGIEVLPPSINNSFAYFNVENNAIRYSMAALKNVGIGTIEHIAELRNHSGKFKSISDFANRINPRFINKRTMENLIKSGAFDEIDPNRAKLFNSIDIILNTAIRAESNRNSGQDELFSMLENGPEEIKMPNMKKWRTMDTLANEFEAIGFYFSGHPLDDYQKPLQRVGVNLWQDFNKQVAAGATAGKLAGTVTYKQERKSKNGNSFAFAGFSDPTGQFEAIIFSETLSAYRDLLEVGSAVIIKVEASYENEGVRLRILDVKVLDNNIMNIASGIKVSIDNTSCLDEISKIIEEGGNAPINIVTKTTDGLKEVEISLGAKFKIYPDLIDEMRTIPGVTEILEL